MQKDHLMARPKGAPGIKHRELSQVLRRQIEAGRYRSGEQIPTEHELGRAFDVSRNTIRQAIATLEEEGYLLRRRGAGTFVGEIGSQGQPISPLKEMGYLLVDLPQTDVHWVMQTSRAAHEWLTPWDVHLSISHLATEDLVKGRQMGILRPGKCQAILVDGWVQDLHCKLLEQLGVPYLVLGNRPLGTRHPQARFAIDRMITRGTRYLHELRPEQPVALLVEPMRLHLTHEIFEGYARTAQSLPQGHPILQTTEDAAADDSLGHLLDGHPGPLSIIATDGQWALAAREYRRRGLSPQEWPVLVLGDPMVPGPEDRAMCHWLPFSGDQLIREALPPFVQAFNEGHTGQVRIDVDVERIEPPLRS
jgi:DNA-binding LacI/PurR family transcriptional regulator